MRPQDKIVERVATDWSEQPYYAQAETPAFLAEFWGEDTSFSRQFNKLKLGDVAELACGRGRHAAQIAQKCGSLRLLDVNQSNVDACAERFTDLPNVQVILCNGYDLSAIESDSLDTVFSYDAMVHFEPDIVAAYLVEFSRVLRSGGRALIHHSNYSSQPGVDYSKNPHYRNYMTLDLIKHFILRTGMEILSQETFGWGGGGTYFAGIDTLTLMQKN